MLPGIDRAMIQGNEKRNLWDMFDTDAVAVMDFVWYERLAPSCPNQLKLEHHQPFSR